MRRFRTFFPWVSSTLLALLSASVWAGQTLSPVPGRPPAPPFSLTDLDGVQHRLAAYRGQVVIVNFWATWCPPCRKEMPSMDRAWKRLRGQDVALLAINVGETEDQVWVFASDHPVSFPLLLDEAGKTVARWPVRGLPTTFVLDKQGRIAYQALGDRNWDDPKLLKILRSLARDPR